MKIDGDDIQGDGVNVAARLEGFADPGGICVSGGVYDQVRDRVDAPFEDMGMLLSPLGVRLKGDWVRPDLVKSCLKTNRLQLRLSARPRFSNARSGRP